MNKFNPYITDGLIAMKVVKLALKVVKIALKVVKIAMKEVKMCNESNKNCNERVKIFEDFVSFSFVLRTCYLI